MLFRQDLEEDTLTLDYTSGVRWPRRTLPCIPRPNPIPGGAALLRHRLATSVTVLAVPMSLHVHTTASRVSYLLKGGLSTMSVPSGVFGRRFEAYARCMDALRRSPTLFWTAYLCDSRTVKLFDC